MLRKNDISGRLCTAMANLILPTIYQSKMGSFIPAIYQALTPSGHPCTPFLVSHPKMDGEWGPRERSCRLRVGFKHPSETWSQRRGSGITSCSSEAVFGLAVKVPCQREIATTYHDSGFTVAHEALFGTSVRVFLPPCLPRSWSHSKKALVMLVLQERSREETPFHSG